MNEKLSTGTPIMLTAMVIVFFCIALLVCGTPAYAQEVTTTTNTTSAPTTTVNTTSTPDSNITVTPSVTVNTTATVTTYTDGNGTDNGPYGNYSNEPLWFIIRNITENHMNELRERVFCYRINNSGNASEQAQLIRERNMEIHNATRQAQTHMDALVLAKQAGEITQQQFVAAVQLIHQKAKNNANNANGLQNAASIVGDDVLEEAGVTTDEIDELVGNAEEARNKAKKIKEDHGQGQSQGQGQGQSQGQGQGQSQGQGQGQSQGNSGNSGNSNTPGTGIGDMNPDGSPVAYLYVYACHEYNNWLTGISYEKSGINGQWLPMMATGLKLSGNDQPTLLKITQFESLGWPDFITLKLAGEDLSCVFELALNDSLAINMCNCEITQDPVF